MKLITLNTLSKSFDVSSNVFDPDTSMSAHFAKDFHVLATHTDFFTKYVRSRHVSVEAPGVITATKESHHHLLSKRDELLIPNVVSAPSEECPDLDQVFGPPIQARLFHFVRQQSDNMLERLVPLLGYFANPFLNFGE